MCLLDTADGALMMALYTSTTAAQDRIAILYYSIVLTVVTVVVAIVIGIIQLLSLVLNVAEPSGKFWDGVAVAGDHYDIIGQSSLYRMKTAAADHPGGSICGSFLVFGALSVLLYKSWRRRFDEQRRIRQQPHRLEPAIEDRDLAVEPNDGLDRAGVVEDCPTNSHAVHQAIGKPLGQTDTTGP
ncbi:MAG: hypothetical protein Q9225_002414 [Loekoesia sp. 1 TL-2023]